MDFASDNIAGAAPEILTAIAAANMGTVPSYGEDPWTAKARGAIDAVFERKCASFLLATGTAANALALAALAPPFGAIFCHSVAHVMEDECGAPEFFTAGTKLVGIDTPDGKITPAALRAKLAAFPRGMVTQVQPAALSLSQATECGTVYSCDEIAELTRIAHDAGVLVHMDGARFANALVAEGCTPAEMSWKAGIDILSFGATKNGALACESVIFFDPAKAETFPYLRKRGGHTLSKGRFLGSQMAAYLGNNLWLDLARTANAQAAALAAGLATIPGVRAVWPCAINEIFVLAPRAIDTAWRTAGAHYYEWTFPAPDKARMEPREDEIFIRFATSFATPAADIERLIALGKTAAQSVT
jgi:threonine aldolase